jgi:hypothetical protein
VNTDSLSPSAAGPTAVFQCHRHSHHSLRHRHIFFIIIIVIIISGIIIKLSLSIPCSSRTSTFLFYVIGFPLFSKFISLFLSSERAVEACDSYIYVLLTQLP